jgi:hypothetical protein
MLPSTINDDLSRRTFRREARHGIIGMNIRFLHVEGIQPRVFTAYSNVPLSNFWLEIQ